RGRIRVLLHVLQHLLDTALLHLRINLLRHDTILLDSQGGGIKPGALQSACVLIEAHDEWQDQDRRYLSEESMALLNPPAPIALEPTNTSTTRSSRKEIAATA
ncbi:MAG TPA: hypothetical protein VHC43_13985, partial [Mycobacteriales bacterium]|nr:hypothetical protein [Mycobacteriales bacterium]